MGTVVRNGLCYNGRNLEEVYLSLIDMNYHQLFFEKLKT